MNIVRMSFCPSLPSPSSLFNFSREDQGGFREDQGGFREEEKSDLPAFYIASSPLREDREEEKLIFSLSGDFPLTVIKRNTRKYREDFLVSFPNLPCNLCNVKGFVK